MYAIERIKVVQTNRIIRKSHSISRTNKCVDLIINTSRLLKRWKTNNNRVTSLVITERDYWYRSSLHVEIFLLLIFLIFLVRLFGRKIKRVEHELDYMWKIERKIIFHFTKNETFLLWNFKISRPCHFLVSMCMKSKGKSWNLVENSSDFWFFFRIVQEKANKINFNSFFFAQMKSKMNSNWRGEEEVQKKTKKKRRNFSSFSSVVKMKEKL